MKQPPYDDDLIPTLALFGASLVFAVIVLAAMYSLRDLADFVPPSSTLAPLPK